MSLESADIYEIKARWDSLSMKYVELATQIAPLLDKFGKYRQELQALALEINRRGYEADSPEELTARVENAIQERGNQDGTSPDQTSGHTEPRPDTIESS